MPPVQEIAIMLGGTLIALFVSLIITLGSIIISMRLSSWRTLLMVAGAMISLIARTTATAVGYLEMARVVSLATYQRTTGMTYALGTAGNLIFAIGFLALAMYMFRQMAPMAKKYSVPV
jgi:hypothetical protein